MTQKTKPGMAHRKPWTETECDHIRKHYADGETAPIAAQLGRTARAVFQKARDLGLNKSMAFFQTVASGRLQQDGRSMGKLFTKGHKPWNTGIKGWVAPGSEATRFQSGGKPTTTLPVGSYRRNKGGHLQRKIGDAPGAAHNRWRCVAELVWIEAYGPVPSGHIVVFRPGRFSAVLGNITLDAVECISRAENARRNHPSNRSPEYAKLCQLKGAISRQVNRITQESKAS